MSKHYSIKISGYDKNFLSVKLPDLLLNIRDGESIKWAILWIYAVGNLGENISMVDFEKKVDDSENGLLIEWKDLVNLSTKFDDVMELRLIGAAQVDKLKKYEIEDEMYANCDYTIELIDSSFWLIHSIYLKNLELIGTKLPGAKFGDDMSEID